MIGTVEANIETMRMNAASMICDQIKLIKYKKGCEQCIKLCYYENRHMDIKIVLKHKKGQDIYKTTRTNFNFKKEYVQYMNDKKYMLVLGRILRSMV